MAKKPKSRAGIDDVVLIPVSPSQRKKRRRLLISGAIVAALVLFFGGLWSGNSGALDTSETNRRLRAELKSQSRELEAARNELALYRTDTEVTQQARENLRQEIKGLRDQAAELEEAVAFYKNVMAPGGSERGMQIEKLTLQPTEKEGEYSYKVVLVQSGDNRNYLSGDISLTLRGSRDGQAIKLSGSDWLNDGSETRFRFRYFQELNGRFILPEGVEIIALDVDAESGGRNRYETQKTIKWQ
ncbi:hypothetical protein Y5S_01481 [Alcanivorax nanhaiticus]|uniref:Uncharacterized protein n=1 Tax=Alcanivorax nanhaiticus TaxID=1177154 RepID=A0A095SKE3_9GAMM|nr:DUF6776 family protein [Alcanivorax nanhaiticus]KGD65047.1 hypothetical protein Y5S_01481 [Alcanivorax nanhaiticus]